MYKYNRSVVYALAMMFFCAALACADNKPIPQSMSAGALAKGNNIFAVNLYKQLRSTEGNLFFSPYSIRTALAMTYAGARGTTAAQMQSSLHFTLQGDELNKAFAQSIKTLNTGGKDNYDMNVANSLWGDKTCTFLLPFREANQSSYNSALKKVDFINAFESARLQINDWVEEQTNDKIMDLIPPGGVNANTRLALVNAVYFKGLWNKQFDKKLTRAEAFHTAVGTTIETQLMSFSKPGNLPFFAGDGIRIVELDYQGDDISMVIILPDKTDGLADIEARLNEFQLNSWIESLEKKMVKVQLPRFSMNWGAKNIVPDLRQLGMRDAFIAQVANFSGIDGTRNLVISSAFHKAFVDVNEEGTEAAAATGVMVGVTSVPPPPEIFRADHPFLFLIREKATGSILFMGRLTKPATE